MIIEKYKALFIHIGKTGGCSIEHTFNPNVGIDQSMKKYGNTSFKDKHYTAKMYKQKLKEKFENYYKFAFVRNPWDLEVSLWNWFKLTHNINYNFAEHIRRRSLPCARTKTPTRMGFSKFININGKNAMDYIGKMENIQEDFDQICDNIGAPRKKLPHKNKTKHKSYTEYYNSKLKEAVENAYKKEIEMFNYEFGK